jgi:hypothetical protein
MPYVFVLWPIFEKSFKILFETFVNYGRCTRTYNKI